MKDHAPMNEGPDAFMRFRKAVKSVLSVPKSALPPKPHREKKKATKPKVAAKSTSVAAPAKRATKSTAKAPVGKAAKKAAKKTTKK
ncbi:MAG: hypothetical protein V4555_01255 [Acidobacteriota bacterium]